MLSWLSAVIKDVGVGAAGFFEGIRQDRHSVKGTLIVDGVADHGPRMTTVQLR
jgi:hypothetical protein